MMALESAEPIELQRIFMTPTTATENHPHLHPVIPVQLLQAISLLINAANSISTA